MLVYWTHKTVAIKRDLTAFVFISNVDLYDTRGLINKTNDVVPNVRIILYLAARDAV